MTTTTSAAGKIFDDGVRLCLVGLLCLQITCVWCKERVVLPVPEKKEKLHYLDIIKHVAKTVRSWVLFCSALSEW